MAKNLKNLPDCHNFIYTIFVYQKSKKREVNPNLQIHLQHFEVIPLHCYVNTRSNEMFELKSQKETKKESEAERKSTW